MCRLLEVNQKAVFFGMLLFLMLCCLVGCAKKEEKQLGKIEYEVCSQEMIPDQLQTLIEGKKQHAFAMSYISGEEMYVVIGYGAHDTRNLYVRIKDFYMTDNAAYIDTELLTTEMTPSDGSEAGDNSMYPYIVIKCARFDAPIYYNAP